MDEFFKFRGVELNTEVTYKGRPKPSSAECKWTIKPLSSKPTSVQAYSSPSRKCNRKMDKETTYK